MSIFGNNNNKKESEKTFQDIINNKMVPMLLEYPPFKEMIKYVVTNEMNSIIKEIREVEKIEKTKILDVNNLHKEKAKIAPTVLYLSNQLNSKNSNTARELDDVKDRLLEINTEIVEKEQEIQELLVTKEHMNLDLLRETLSCAYDLIKQDEKTLNPLLKEIEDMRKELENKRILRDKLQARINSTYGFIHGFMGSKETEKIDEQMF